METKKKTHEIKKVVLDFKVIPPWEQEDIENVDKVIQLDKEYWNEIERREISKKSSQLLEGVLTKYSDFLEMAKEFVDLQPIYYDESKIWWLWDWKKKCWKISDETDIFNLVDKAVQNSITIQPKAKSEITEALKRKGRLNKPKRIKPTWIQFGDRIVDIETLDEFNITHNFFATNPIPWKIGKNENTPNIDKIFEEWVGKKNKRLLYEIVAYCMLPDYPIHRIFCLIGAGRNGKTTFLKLLLKFIGHKNICSTELELLVSSKFEAAKLYKKLICMMGETEFTTIKKTSLLKKLTGQDPIGFEFKNKTPFDDINYAKIIIATNSLPITEDKTDGFYRRWQIIDFPNKFTEKEDPLKQIQDYEFENLAKKSIRILSELMKNREFANEGTIEQRKLIYEDKSDYLESFIETECDSTDINSDIEFSEFYNPFCKYCNKKGFRELSKNMVGRILRKKGFQSANKTIGETSIRVIQGLKLKKDGSTNIENNENILHNNLF